MLLNAAGMRDICRFIETAQELGLYIIIRPSPYICSEWEFGGLPAWLLRDRNMRLRCSYEPYLNAVKNYYSELIPKLVPYQIDRGGNIILMQIENEYGYYGNDKAYLEFRFLWRNIPVGRFRFVLRMVPEKTIRSEPVVIWAISLSTV